MKKLRHGLRRQVRYLKVIVRDQLQKRIGHTVIGVEDVKKAAAIGKGIRLPGRSIQEDNKKNAFELSNRSRQSARHLLQKILEGFRPSQFAIDVYEANPRYGVIFSFKALDSRGGRWPRAIRREASVLRTGSLASHRHQGSR